MGSRRATNGRGDRALVVVRDFDFLGITLLPDEAHSVLVVDPNAVLSTPAAAEAFEAITRRNCQLP